MSTHWSENPVGPDALAVQLHLEVVGAYVGGSFNSAALNSELGDLNRIALGARGEPEVDIASEAGSVGDLHGGSAQLLGVLQRVVRRHRRR
ncbi:hypothetical protein WG939_05495 [Corynebacterium sp. H130]|uniref:hypothetical protein n=1 Tax=Corynebacterium sp. H130 TaxID=3133444 RepID=UPI0030AD0CC5